LSYLFQNSACHLFVPNIKTAILARLGGVPWRLKRDTTNKLLAGVGAFTSATTKNKACGLCLLFQ